MRAAVLALCAAALVVAACDDVREPVVGETSPEPIQEAVDHRCEPVDDPALQTITEGLDGSAELVRASAVVSEEGPLTFVSAEVHGVEGGAGPPIGTWAILGDVDAEELVVVSVNAVARRHSDWPDGTEDGLSETDDGGEESVACVEAAEHPR